MKMVIRETAGRWKAWPLNGDSPLSGSRVPPGALTDISVHQSRGGHKLTNDGLVALLAVPQESGSPNSLIVANPYSMMV